MSGIFQSKLPYDPLEAVPLPGIQALDPKAWLMVDDAYSAQMALRVQLLSERPEDVLATSQDAGEAANELLSAVLAHLQRDHAGFSVSAGAVICPDGRSVSLEGEPMHILGQIVQNDFAILQKPEGADEHVLTAAVVCFPANWRLTEKYLRPLTNIHTPVEGYEGDLARRVQRLFDGVRAGRPMWRKNALWYDDPTLHQPHRSDGRDTSALKSGRFMRSERQTIYRLPLSQAVVFGIHTFVVPAENLS